jgi:hypothetical protein
MIQIESFWNHFLIDWSFLLKPGDIGEIDKRMAGGVDNHPRKKYI